MPDLHHSLGVTMGRSSCGWVLTVYSLQEVHFYGMLGYAVLKLVKQLAAVAKRQVALVQLKLKRSRNVSFDLRKKM